MNQDNSDAMNIHDSFIENSPLGIATANLECKFLSANHAYLEMIGYTMEELKELTFLDITHPDDRTKNIEDAKKIAKGDRSITQFEKRYIRKDGQTINVKVTTWLLKDKDGNPTTHVSAFEDITEKKAMEEKMQSSEKTLHSFIEYSPLGIATTNLEGEFVSANQAYTEMIGYTMDELKELTYLDITHPDDRDQNIEHLQKIVNGDTSLNIFEKKYIRKDGQIINVKVRTWLIKDKDGNPTTHVGAFEDITERKIFEDKLQKTDQELRLYLDILTHDVRNYQASVIGYLDIALISKNPLEAENYIKKAQANVSNTENILQNASIVMMLKEPSVDSLKPSKLLKIVEEAKEYIIDQFPHKTIDIDIEKIDKDTSIIADYLCKQLFVNLFSNAVKFTAQENVKIAVYLEKSTKGKCAVVIADSARGVPKEEREKIFERFSEFRKKGEGSGLGLYIVQTLIQRYKGRISVESRVKEDYTKGSKFIVEFNTS